jgi:hypothetical protein
MANADFGSVVEANGEEITKELKKKTDDESGNDKARNKALREELEESGLDSVYKNATVEDGTVTYDGKNGRVTARYEDVVKQIGDTKAAN